MGKHGSFHRQLVFCRSYWGAWIQGGRAFSSPRLPLFFLFWCRGCVVRKKPPGHAIETLKRR